jgi:CzcA family heavy metal efflux pump
MRFVDRIHRAVVSGSVRLRYLVVGLGAAMLLIGFFEVGKAPVDVFPEFAPPTVEVQTECVGLSPQEVEQAVTTPLEQALSGTPGLDVMRSSSISQFSDIVMLFKQGTNVLHARELVNEKLSVARPVLPNWAAPPVITEPKSATSRILMIGITSGSLNGMQESVLAEDDIKARLLQVPGVANISIWGNQLQSLQIEVDPIKLHQSGLSLHQVFEASSNALEVGSLTYDVSNVIATGGFVVTPNQQLQVEHEVPIVTPDDLKQAVITVRSDGSKVRVGDVANVASDVPPQIGEAVIDGKPGLLMIVDKFPWGNTRHITRDIDARLGQIGPTLPQLKIDPTIFRPATFIDDAIHNLTSSIVIGSLLVLVVLALFLFEWRSALISIVTIPVSLTTSLLILRARHVTINTMILAGIVIALGAIVDDAIVDIENIVRRLRQHRAEGSTSSTARIIVDASVEVRSAVIYASLIEIVALTPIFFLRSLTGSFFGPLAFAYALCVSVSLIVAVVMTPALAMLLLRGAPLERHGSPIALALQAVYGRFLSGIVRRPLPAIVATGLIIAVGAGVAPRLGESLFPTFKERDFLVHFITNPGTSLDEQGRITTRVQVELLKVPGVRDVGAHIGRAVGGEEVNDVNFSEDWVSIDAHANYDRTLKQIEQVVGGYPGLYQDVQTYLRERTKEALTGSGNAIVVRVFGPNLEVISQKAREIDQTLGRIKGTSDHHVELASQVPEIDVEVNLAKAQQYGLKPGDVRRAASTLVAGEEIGSAYKNGQAYDTFVWGSAPNRNSVDSVREIRLDTPGGGQVRLGDIADVQVQPVPNVIHHESGSRSLDVGTEVSGRDLGSVARDIRGAVAKIQFPQGYHAEVLGEYQERQNAQRHITRYAIVAAAGVLLLLWLSFRRWQLAVLAFLTLPVALIGGEFSAYLFSNGTISLGALVGFFTVLGIVARNGIMMITHYQHLETVEGMPFGPELVVRGAQERLAPILMTGLAAGLALVPLVVRGDIPGQEIEYPLAIVILGGLVASALVNLFILPTLYLRFAPSRRSQGKKDADQQSAIVGATVSGQTS